MGRLPGWGEVVVLLIRWSDPATVEFMDIWIKVGA